MDLSTIRKKLNDNVTGIVCKIVVSHVSVIEMETTKAPYFSSDVNFCPRCGAILPTLGSQGGLACVVCKFEVDVEIMEELEVKYVIEFNTKSDYIEEQQLKSAQSKTDGPLVERRCPRCGNDTMSYASLQLRSADEGQTIFYTCTKCQFKETENS
uniref:DNA-directed RNA polymerase I subunit RPA12 n=1 Tax=Simocephalus serrulatus TaxID=117539 RepID=A0A4Y7NQ99_9CRUS|nr:EOG090X0LKA [Simocephalus serrulatus]